MPFQVSPVGNDKAVRDSLLIPFKDLKTNIFSRSQVNDSNSLIQRAIYGILTTFAQFPLQGILGINKSVNQQPSPTFGIININYSFTYTLVVDFFDHDIYIIPIPVEGNNSGVGSLSFLDVFSNAVKINAGSNIVQPSILIPLDTLQKYGLKDLNKLILNSTSDNRDCFIALFNYLVQDPEVPIRDSENSSSIIQKSLNSWSIANTSQSYFSKDNPVTGIDLHKLNLGLITLMNRSVNLNIQTKLDNETLDLNIVPTTR